MRFLQFESYNLFEKLNLTDKFKGWEKVMEHKCMSNELTDAKNINMPDFTKDLSDKDWFIYAGYLKPGYHKLLIYDPSIERAFCKDFMVNLNLREDIFPEFPKIDQEISKKAPNVWRPWHEDAQEDIFKSF